MWNIEFPQHLDFSDVHWIVLQIAEGKMEMYKNFWVETAEYANTPVRPYTLTFDQTAST